MRTSITGEPWSPYLALCFVLHALIPKTPAAYVLLSPGERNEVREFVKWAVGIAISVAALIALADPFPNRPEFNHYQALLNHSPFAIATVVPPTMPDFARDLYGASAGCSGDGAVVTLASATDKNFKERLRTKGPNEHGFVIDTDCGY